MSAGPLKWWSDFVWSLGWLTAMGGVNIKPPAPTNSAVSEPQSVQQAPAKVRTCNLSFERLYYEYDDRQSSLSESDSSGGLVDLVGHMGSIEIKRIEGDRFLSEELGKEFLQCPIEAGEQVCTFGSLLPEPGQFFRVSFPGGLGSKTISINRGPGTVPLSVTENPDPANPGGCEVGEWRDWQKEEDGKFAFPLKDTKGVKLAKSRTYTCNNFDCSTPRPARARRGYPIDLRFYA
ncbi:hypothetical protein TWF281_000931 [Arthrobotrys megalospora]